MAQRSAHTLPQRIWPGGQVGVGAQLPVVLVPVAACVSLMLPGHLVLD